MDGVGLGYVQEHELMDKISGGRNDDGSVVQTQRLGGLEEGR